MVNAIHISRNLLFYIFRPLQRKSLLTKFIIQPENLCYYFKNSVKFCHGSQLVFHYDQKDRYFGPITFQSVAKKKNIHVPWLRCYLRANRNELHPESIRWPRLFLQHTSLNSRCGYTPPWSV